MTERARRPKAESQRGNMAFLKNFFIRRKKLKVEQAPKRAEVKAEQGPQILDFSKEQKAGEEKTKAQKAKARYEQIAYRVLRKPRITEKSSDLTKQNQYVFELWPRANKDAVKKGIEELYNVDVEQVRIIKVPAKRRRLGRITGWRKGSKKAIIKLREGQRIEVLPR